MVMKFQTIERKVGNFKPSMENADHFTKPCFQIRLVEWLCPTKVIRI